jgi:hypothetical protein
VVGNSVAGIVPIIKSLIYMKKIKIIISAVSILRRGYVSGLAAMAFTGNSRFLCG